MRVIRVRGSGVQSYVAEMSPTNSLHQWRDRSRISWPDWQKKNKLLTGRPV